MGDEAQDPIEPEIVDVDEDSRSFQEEDLVDDSATDHMAYYDDDVSRWEIPCGDAKEEFEQTLQDLDEAGFHCPDLSGRG